MDLWLVALASEITDRQKAVFACWRGEESENISLASLNQPGGPMSSRLLWVQKLTVIPWCCSRPLCPHTERQERNHVNHHLVDFQLQSWAWCDRRVSLSVRCCVGVNEPDDWTALFAHYPQACYNGKHARLQGTHHRWTGQTELLPVTFICFVIIIWISQIC